MFSKHCRIILKLFSFSNNCKCVIFLYAMPLAGTKLWCKNVTANAFSLRVQNCNLRLSVRGLERRMRIQNVALKIHFPVPKCLCTQGTKMSSTALVLANVCVLLLLTPFPSPSKLNPSLLFRLIFLLIAEFAFLVFSSFFVSIVSVSIYALLPLSFLELHGSFPRFNLSLFSTCLSHNDVIWSASIQT